MYQLIDLSATHFPERYSQVLLRAGCLADRAALADPAMLGAKIEAARRCFDQGAEAFIADARLLYAAWPFRLAAIHGPAHLRQGTADTLVPYAVNKPVAEALPQCVWHELPDAGHFVAISHARSILACAAAVLAPAEPGDRERTN